MPVNIAYDPYCFSDIVEFRLPVSFCSVYLSKEKLKSKIRHFLLQKSLTLSQRMKITKVVLQALKIKRTMTKETESHKSQQRKVGDRRRKSIAIKHETGLRIESRKCKSTESLSKPRLNENEEQIAKTKACRFFL